MDSVLTSLKAIVGDTFASNEPEELYVYSRDLGTTEPYSPQYVVAPRTTEEVQDIVRLANREKIPLVPLGGGLTLAGLVMPLKGGIIVDMKRMDSVIEVNERARYAVIEAGVSQGKLVAYLHKHHPTLVHSEPGAPAQATVGGNIAIHGQGDLAQPYGFNSDMVNGLEVVLPTGEVCRVGSCSVSPHWFTMHPLPDLGLFLGWCSTTGIITRVSLKLYPAKRIRDSGQFVLEDANLVPDILYRISHTEMAGDLIAVNQELPVPVQGLHIISIFIAGDSEEEVEFKRRLIRLGILQEYIRRGDGGLIGLSAAVRPRLPRRPPISTIQDIKKGGGFEYVGAILPVDTYPECCRRGADISSRHNIAYTLLARVIGSSHAMMFSWSYVFNRADPETVRHAREALFESDELAIELGGIPWKPGVYGQKLILERMEPNTLRLMQQIKALLDPNGIMNPGNWEVSECPSQTTGTET